MFWFNSRIPKQRVIPVFRGGKRACVEGGARPRKNRNDVGLRLFVMKDDDAFLLRRRRHFVLVKSRTKHSTLLACSRYKKYKVESSYSRRLGVRKLFLRRTGRTGRTRRTGLWGFQVL